MPATRLWDAEYLAGRVGDASVNVASYYADRRDFGRIRSDKMTLATSAGRSGQSRSVASSAATPAPRGPTRPFY
jgi:hypothetical protein